MAALVLGASTPLGRRIAGLLENPLRVSRKAMPGWICADIRDPRTLSELPAFDTIYSSAPIWDLHRALPFLLSRGQVSRVLAFSSTSRFTKSDSRENKEREVAAALEDGEIRTIAACDAVNVSWTILRPTLIYAEGEDQNVTRIAGLIRRFGFFPLAGSGSGRRQPVHAQDLANGAIAAVSSEAARNRSYNLPGGETLSYREMVGRVFDALQMPRRIIPVPQLIWSLIFVMARPLVPGATAAMGSRMAEDLVFDQEPAGRDFGWAPRAFHPQFSR